MLLEEIEEHKNISENEDSEEEDDE